MNRFLPNFARLHGLFAILMLVSIAGHLAPYWGAFSSSEIEDIPPPKQGRTTISVQQIARQPLSEPEPLPPEPHRVLETETPEAEAVEVARRTTEREPAKPEAEIEPTKSLQERPREKQAPAELKPPMALAKAELKRTSPTPKITLPPTPLENPSLSPKPDPAAAIQSQAIRLPKQTRVASIQAPAPYEVPLETPSASEDVPQLSKATAKSAPPRTAATEIVPPTRPTTTAAPTSTTVVPLKPVDPVAENSAEPRPAEPPPSKPTPRRPEPVKLARASLPPKAPPIAKTPPPLRTTPRARPAELVPKTPSPKTPRQVRKPRTAQPPTTSPQIDAEALETLVSRLSTGVDSIPSIRSRVLPRYPPDLHQRRIEGRVVVRLLVTASGRAADVRLLESSGYPQFDRAAVDAVRQWEFRAAKMDAQEIDYYINAPVIFQLR